MRKTNTIVVFLLIVVLTLAMGTKIAFAEDDDPQKGKPVGEEKEICISDALIQETNKDKSEFYIQSQGIDEYESIILEGVDYWYENLPVYGGKTQETFIDAKAIESFDTANNSKAIGISVASILIDRVSQEKDLRFGYWQDTDLTEPVSIYNLDDSLYGYAFGIVDDTKKLVGYMITGTNEKAPPILEYSYDPARFLILEQVPKVYFSCATGIFTLENDMLRSITGVGISSLSELKNEEMTQEAISFDIERTMAVQTEWAQYRTYAGVAEELESNILLTENALQEVPDSDSGFDAIFESNDTLEIVPDTDNNLDVITEINDESEIIPESFNEIELINKTACESEAEVQNNDTPIDKTNSNGQVEECEIVGEIVQIYIGNDTKPIINDESPNTQSAAAATQTCLPNTADHTWLTLCTYTTMSMYFDAIGRKIEPNLLGSTRPHSIKLNQLLHSLYGHSPGWPAIASGTLAWANSKKLSPNMTFTNYLVTSSNADCWSRHKIQINSGIPTMVGYNSPAEDHITMGIGYIIRMATIIRDTWTQNDKPMNSTYHYNKAGYNFRVLGLNYTNSNSSTAWGSVVLKQGDSNFNVLRLKIMLHLLYYSPGSLSNNTFEAATTSAVKAFQQANGLVADGIVGSATYSKLMVAHIMMFDGNSSNWRVLSLGSQGDDVAQLQLRLYRMGYLKDTCDGIFGNNTYNALVSYQKAKALTADGIAGAATFAKLYSSTDSYPTSCHYMRCYVCYP